MPPNRALQDGQDGEFYVMCIFTATETVDERGEEGVTWRQTQCCCFEDHRSRAEGCGRLSRKEQPGHWAPAPQGTGSLLDPAREHRPSLCEGPCSPLAQIQPTQLKPLGDAGDQGRRQAREDGPGTPGAWQTPHPPYGR